MRWRVAVLILPALFLLSAPLVASNMGVALRMQPTWYPQRLHFVSLPWLYIPATAEALCRDLGGSGHVSEILRWDETTSSFVDGFERGNTSGWSAVNR